MLVIPKSKKLSWSNLKSQISSPIVPMGDQIRPQSTRVRSMIPPGREMPCGSGSFPARGCATTLPSRDFEVVSRNGKNL